MVWKPLESGVEGWLSRMGTPLSQISTHPSDAKVKVADFK